MDKIQFSFYDFFGYLASGLLLAFSIDYFFNDLALFKTQEPKAIQSIIVFLLIYIMGHILAAPSAWLLETKFVKKYLGHPRETLLKPTTNPQGSVLFFREYYRPLAKDVIAKIRNKFSIKDDKELTPEKCGDIFHLIYSKVKSNELSLNRLNIFLTLYGFARNVSFTCFIITIMILIQFIIQDHWCKWYWLLIFFFTGIVMLFRFLKFFRYYVYDMYLSYLALTEKDDTDKDEEKSKNWFESFIKKVFC